MPRFAARFFFDAGSGICLWADNDETRAAFDTPLDHDQLPIEATTADEVARVLAWYNTSLNWGDPPAPTPWNVTECEQFNDAAARLLERFRVDLGPDWVVVDQFRPVAPGPIPTD